MIRQQDIGLERNFWHGLVPDYGYVWNSILVYYTLHTGPVYMVYCRVTLLNRKITICGHQVAAINMRGTPRTSGRLGTCFYIMLHFHCYDTQWIGWSIKSVRYLLDTNNRLIEREDSFIFPHTNHVISVMVLNWLDHQKYGTKCVPYLFKMEHVFYLSNTKQICILQNSWKP